MNRRPLIIPDIGSDRETIRISNWLTDVGDVVEVGDRVVELLVPGVTFDVSSDIGGVLDEIVCDTDTVVSVGETIGWIQVVDETDNGIAARRNT